MTAVRSWDVHVPAHEITHRGTGQRYPVTGGDVIVTATDQDDARMQAARAMHVRDQIPPWRHMLAQTAAAAGVPTLHTTAADERRAKVQRAGGHRFDA